MQLFQKKGHGSGTTATIIRYNNFKWRNGRYNENIQITWIISINNKTISEVIKSEAKKQKGGFPSVLLGTLAASILGNALAREVVIWAGQISNFTSSIN